MCLLFVVFCFFKRKTAYEMRISDWSSDVCSSDIRGTDIQLGGNAEMRILAETEGLDGEVREKMEAQIRAEVATEKEKVLAAGGLYVIGTERHESRRIDNQLRGRSGRQGDPGASKFFLSLEDDLLRIFGSERMD